MPALKHTPSIVALLAVLALLALTVAAVSHPGDLNLWHTVTLTVAWVAVLASALLVGDRAREGENLDTASAPAPSAAAVPADESAAESKSALLEFARELHATLESDRLRLLISRRLPSILGRRNVWIVARVGSRQQIIVPSGPGQTGAVPMISDDARQWATFPLKADGRTIGVLGTALPPWGISPRDHQLFDSVGAIIGQALATAHAFETMREASVIDPLTGCVTRAEGMRRFQVELGRASRSRTSLAVLMLDLDHFKRINDRLGHEAGDAVLSAVGQTLLTTLRASDVRCRWGGEEFLLVLPDSNLERARRASENLRQRIASTTVPAADRAVRVTASIGVTLTSPADADIAQLLARADAALYQAKSLGRNRIRFVPNATSSTPASDEPEESAEKAVNERRSPQSAEPSDIAWTGPERRDKTRRDRRKCPSPGRRWTDTEVVDGPWRPR